jgi:hypothetical protein
MPKWFIVVVVGVTVDLEEETKALQVRFPAKIYNQLTEMAKKSRRSLNAEIIICLEEHLALLGDNNSPQHVLSVTFNLEHLRTTFSLEKRQQYINNVYRFLKSQLLISDGDANEPLADFKPTTKPKKPRK